MRMPNSTSQMDISMKHSENRSKVVVMKLPHAECWHCYIYVSITQHHQETAYPEDCQPVCRIELPHRPDCP